MSQTGGEFTLTPEAQTIANLCSLTVLHRVGEAHEQLAQWFDLNERQAEWVRAAKAGDDADGYAEALVGIDQEGWFPVRIRASDAETRVIDGEGAATRTRASPPPEGTDRTGWSGGHTHHPRREDDSQTTDTD